MKPLSTTSKCGANILMIVSFTGCSVNQGIFKVDRCADVPSGAVPAAPGNHVCQWQQAQVRSASADLGVFYQADFVDQSDRLSPAAEQHVARLVQQGSLGLVPLILEPSDDPQRDAARTVMMASAFNAAGAPLTPEQIRIAHPAALGLKGFRAQQVARTASRVGSQGGGQGGGQSGGQGGGGMGGGGLGGFGGGGIF